MSQGAAGRAENLFAQAVKLHQQGVLSEAERGYRRVLAADKKHAGALQYLAMIEGQRGNFADAVRLLRQCVKAHPRLAEARTNLGFALAQTRQHAEAVACYDKALSINPQFLAALNNRGISLRELGRFDDAIANYDRLIASSLISLMRTIIWAICSPCLGVTRRLAQVSSARWRLHRMTHRR